MPRKLDLEAVLTRNTLVDADELERVLAALHALRQAGVRAPLDFVLDPRRGRRIRAGKPGRHPVVRLGRSRRHRFSIP
jgi:hypothetical protein